MDAIPVRDARGDGREVEVAAQAPPDGIFRGGFARQRRRRDGTNRGGNDSMAPMTSMFRPPIAMRLFAALALWAAMLVAAHPVVHATEHCGPSAKSVGCATSCSATTSQHVDASHDDSRELCLLCTLGGGRWVPTAPAETFVFLAAVESRVEASRADDPLVRHREHEHCLTRRGPPSFLPA